MRKGFFLKLAVSSIRKNRKVYYPYMLTAALTTAMLYIMASLKSNPDMPFEMLSFSLALGMGVTTLFSVIFLFYTNSFLMKRRKKEFGLYNVLGMEKKHLCRVVFWETACMLAVTLALGLASGILLDKLMHMLLLRLIGRAATLRFYVSASAMGYAATVVSVAFAAIWLNSVRQIYRAKTVELLRSEQLGEREPKTKWIMTLLGLLMLGAGYWISLTVKDAAMMLLMFFVAVVLVIISTYLLFTAGSITLLKCLRKNKRYYYRPNHFINISGMLHRMKQNAVGLGNICILSTMVLVMAFSTVSLWLGMEDVLNQQCPQDITVDSRRLNLDALEAAVDAALTDAGLTRQNEHAYRYLYFATVQNGSTFWVGDEAEDAINKLESTPSTLYLIPLEDYNRAWGHTETLAPDEALLYSTRGGLESDSLSVLDQTFRIQKRVTDDLAYGVAIASIYPTHFLIVDSMETVLSLEQRQIEAYGKHASNIHNTSRFDINGSDEAKAAFAADLESRADVSVQCRPVVRSNLMELYGGLLFVGLFLSAMFIMAMILIMYYKQITEGYEDRERYRIMRKVGLSRQEIKRSISSQILTVFFLPLLAAGLHVAFAFPGLSTMFRGLSMTNASLMAACAAASFVVFALIYGVLYQLTAKVYYRIVSE